MANMGYCRFENTYQDLEACYEALQEAGGVKMLQAEVNRYEKPFIKDIIQLCRDIVEEFADLEE